MARSQIMKRLREDTSGNVLAIFGAALIPMTMIVGSGLDLATAYMARAKLQNACDAAALAGRQAMEGNTWTTGAADEANKFFDFNFPAGAHNVTERTFTIAPDTANTAQIVGSAKIVLPTALMYLFGKKSFEIEVACDARRDQGNNDVMLVLDVTGSMNDLPSTGGSERKIQLLRDGAAGLYRALNDDENGSITRYGIMPYSHTVNVGRSLDNQDILDTQSYVTGNWRYWVCDVNGSNLTNCVQRTAEFMPGFGVVGSKYYQSISFTETGYRNIKINESSWNKGNGGGASGGNAQGFRTSGDACIEERPSIGNSASPVRYKATVSRADVDQRAATSVDARFQFGRYDPGVQNGMSQVGCPSEATRLQPYDDEEDFQRDINLATARVTGGTYHDVGMLWGTRFISRTGFFAGNNPTEINDIPVNQHIVFMTDGKLDTGNTLYSAHGVERYQERTTGSGSLDARHLARFAAACDVAKSMGITVWVIALDVTDTDAIDDCATSEAHFYTSDGSDLEEIFGTIGQGIGNLRLTR